LREQRFVAGENGGELRDAERKEESDESGRKPATAGGEDVGESGEWEREIEGKPEQFTGGGEKRDEPER